MYLRQVELVNFRGIQRLSIQIRPNMVLIGENAWGKSSLLAALSLIFNSADRLYQFTETDFHQDKNELILLFTFAKKIAHSYISSDFKQLFSPYEQGFEYLYLRVTAEKTTGSVKTNYDFLDKNGHSIKVKNKPALVLDLIRHYPVYRFSEIKPQKLTASTPIKEVNYQDKLDDEFEALKTLVRHYFLSENTVKTLQEPHLLWDKVQSLCQKLRFDEKRVLRSRLISNFIELFDPQFRPKLVGNKNIRPILLLEDMGARLHPRMMAMIWHLAGHLPIQKLTTTNSVELISQAELQNICRLVRYSDRTKAYQLAGNILNKEELRRLNFHIHYNRSLALFSRTWLLVEGETEVWILSELARLLGINLISEGIRIIEFAQSGLKPLIKYAQAMGIEWYVLTDGDEAGRKYAEVTKSLLSENEPTDSRLTVLPRVDIECFFYTAGFAEVFIRLAHWQPIGNVYPMRKIIQRAIQRTSKPDLAIAISNEIEKRGIPSIPLLFKRLFSKVVGLTRTQEI